jgi:hypothetical protein
MCNGWWRLIASGITQFSIYAGAGSNEVSAHFGQGANLGMIVRVLQIKPSSTILSSLNLLNGLIDEQ